jgi:hypothetical protein
MGFEDSCTPIGRRFGPVLRHGDNPPPGMSQTPSTPPVIEPMFATRHVRIFGQAKLIDGEQPKVGDCARDFRDPRTETIVGHDHLGPDGPKLGREGEQAFSDGRLPIDDGDHDGKFNRRRISWRGHSSTAPPFGRRRGLLRLPRYSPASALRADSVPVECPEIARAALRTRRKRPAFRFAFPCLITEFPTHPTHSDARSYRPNPGCVGTQYRFGNAPRQVNVQ